MLVGKNTMRFYLRVAGEKNPYIKWGYVMVSRLQCPAPFLSVHCSWL